MLSAAEEDEPELRRQLRAARLAERQSKMDAALAEKHAKRKGHLHHAPSGRLFSQPGQTFAGLGQLAAPLST
eukprot:390299-Pelagomonas_calceolata.AAC.3